MRMIILLSILIYSGYYLFKNYKTINLQLKVLLFIGIVGPIWLCYYEINKIKKINLLIANFELTKGKIEEYFIPKFKNGIPSRGISPSRNYIKYSYNVNGKKNQNSYDEDYVVKIPDNKPNLEKAYLVIYEKNNPANSFILLNYPINSDKDLKEYKKMFADKIPKNVFEIDID